MAKNDETVNLTSAIMDKVDRDVRKSVADRMRNSGVPHAVIKDYMENGRTNIPHMDRYIASHGDNALGEATDKVIAKNVASELPPLPTEKKSVKFPELEKSMSSKSPSKSPKESSLHDFIKNKVNKGQTTGFAGIDNEIVEEATRTGNTTKLRTNVEKDIDKIRKEVLKRAHGSKKGKGLGDLEEAVAKAMDLRRQIPPNAPKVDKMALRMNALKGLASKGAGMAKKVAPHVAKAIPGLQLAAGAYDMMDQPELGAKEGSLARKLEDGTATMQDREALSAQPMKMNEDRPDPQPKQIGEAIRDSDLFKKLKGYF